MAITLDGTNGITTAGGITYPNGPQQTYGAKGLGMSGEVWNIVTGSRAGGVTYTNSRGYPIMVSISVTSATNAQFTVTVGGVAFASAQGSGTSNQNPNITFIVPTGLTYGLGISSGTLNRWSELY
jgi:hypothetical protein